MTEPELECSRCKETKLASEFYKRGNRNVRGKGRHSLCKLCFRAEVFEYRRTSEGIRKNLLVRAKIRGKRFGVEATITLNDIVLPEVCPILGIPLAVGVSGHAPSLDRIDNTKGYVPGNVQVISEKANRMKNDASPTDLLLFAKWVWGTYS